MKPIKVEPTIRPGQRLPYRNPSHVNRSTLIDLWGNLTAAFDSFKIAFAAVKITDKTFALTVAELYKVQCRIYAFAAEAYANAASCAITNALKDNLQVCENRIEIKMLKIRATDPHGTSPNVAKSRAADLKAKSDENSTKADALEMKARTAEKRAKAFMENVKAAVEWAGVEG